MGNNFDVVALGELLIDRIDGIPHPGGAPCNVLAMLTKLGKTTAFIGKVGDDEYGEMLKSAIEEVGIDSSNLVKDTDDISTTIAIVGKNENGDRTFTFESGADANLKPEDVKEEIIKASKIFHFGTLTMRTDNCLAATQKAIECAENSEAIRTFDPNRRKDLWEDSHLRECVKYGLQHCDVLKISDDEIEWLLGEGVDYKDAVKQLQRQYNIPLILLSKGKEGSMAFSGDNIVEIEAFKVDSIETTGAGDTFMASIINYILEHDLLRRDKLSNMDSKDMKEMLEFANAAAAIVTTKKGALSVMPNRDEVENFISSKKKELISAIRSFAQRIQGAR